MTAVRNSPSGPLVDLGADFLQMASGATAAAAKTNTRLLQEAVDRVKRAGRGAIVLPDGDYWYNAGTIDINVVCQINDVDNLCIRSAGVGIHHMHLMPGQDANLFNVTGDSKYVTIRDLALDGNRANQTAGLVHGIRADAVSGFYLDNLWIHDISHYGIGVEGFVQEYLFFSNLKIENTGGDGFDQKNKADANVYQHANNISITNFGLNTAEPTQAGWDCRGAWQVSNMVIHYTALDGSGIRQRNGLPLEPGVGFGGHRSHLSNIEIYGPGPASTSTGLEIVAKDVHYSNVYIRDVFFGVAVIGLVTDLAERSSVDGCTVENFGSAAYLTSQYGNYAAFHRCRAKDGPTGFRIRSVGCKLVEPQAYNCSTAGVSTDLVGTELEIISPTIVGPGGAVMTGIDINAADAKIIGGNISACNRGIVSTAARTRATSVTTRNCTDMGILYAVGADDSVIDNCDSRSNGTRGFQTRAARTMIRGGSAVSNGGAGILPDTASVDTIIDKVYLSGNAAPIDDQGTNTVFYARGLTAYALNEAVAAGANSANIDVPLLSSTTYMFYIMADCEDSASVRSSLRISVLVYRSAAAAPVILGTQAEFTAGAGLTSINTSISGNNLRVSVTKAAGNNCRLDTRIQEQWRERTVEFS